MTASRDTTRLRARLGRALPRRPLGLIAALLVPAACSPLPAGSGGNCCDDRQWSGTAEVATAFAAQGATQRLGCPIRIDRGPGSPTHDAPDGGLAEDAGLPPEMVIALSDEGTKKLRDTGDTATCVYHWMACCPGGRPLEVDGRAVVASATRGALWTERGIGRLGRGLSPDDRAAVARGWLDDALAEHASVASFARATLELIAVGAPPRLLAAHQRAGLQEIGHARRCFALARAYGGAALDPGPIAASPPRCADLVRLACDTFAEGCVAETFGALVAERALAGARVRAVRAALRVIAAEEAAHAELAWRTVTWALREGGAPVARALEALAGELRPHAVARAPRLAEPDLRAHGRLGAAERERAARDAWSGVVEPLLADLLGSALL